jgi:hypothetical protein
MTSLARRLTSPLGDRMSIAFRLNSFFHLQPASLLPDSSDVSKLASEPATLAVSAFTLGDFGADDRRRRRYLRAIWDSGAEVIVIVDRASPAGFSRVDEARAFLLRLGRDSIWPASKRSGDALGPAMGGASSLSSGSTAPGSHVIAPVRGAFRRVSQ